jgi:CHASE3 domain sensor protein
VPVVKVVTTFMIILLLVIMLAVASYWPTSD